MRIAMILVLCLLFVLGSNGQDFYSKARSFSIGLINQTGLDHVAIAPFSVWSLMTAAALWTYGDYKEQIANSLILVANNNSFLEDYKKMKRKVLNEASDRIDLENDMLIFIDTDFDVLSEFKETMEGYFDAHVKKLDFTDKNVARIADRYIESRNSRIINIFHDYDFVNASMVMCNVVKFTGYWKTRFNVLNTVEETFYLDDKEYTVKVMKEKMKVPYSNMDSMNANVMELALGEHGKFSLLLLYPHKNKTLREVYNNFNEVTLEDIFDKLENDVKQNGLKEVDVKLPRMKIQTNIVLNKQLSDVGFEGVFASDNNKFSGIADEDIYISSVDHKTEFVIFETGVFVTSSTPGHFDYTLPDPKLEAEAPFIYFVVEKSTKTILVGGLYSKARYV